MQTKVYVTTTPGLLFAFFLICLSCGRNRPAVDETQTASRITDWEGDESRGRTSPDGTRIAFEANRNGNWDIYVMADGNKNLTQLTSSPYNENSPTWSPDGTRIAFDSDRDRNRGIWRKALRGGEVMKVFSSDSMIAYGPSWSPNGKTIAFTGFVKQRAYIWTIAANGGDPMRITNRGDEFWPSWSPDSKHLLYYVGRTDSIMTVGLEDRSIKSMTDGKFFGWSAEYSPDGKWIACISDIGGQPNLWVLSPEGGEPVQITRYGNDAAPSWTPDGKSIILSRRTTYNQLYSIDISGNDPPVQLTLEDNDDFELVASRDGKRIVYSRYQGSDNIWVMRADGSSRRQITNHSKAMVRRPAWSPDGAHVAYLRSVHKDGTRKWFRDIWVVSSSSGDPYRLTYSGDAASPVWTSDGKEIIFASTGVTRGPAQLWRVDIKGDRPLQLTLDDMSKTPMDCSPDGRFILFTGSLDGATRLYKMSTHDKSVSEIPSQFRVIEEAKWSPDGTRIALLSNQNSEKTFDVYMIASGGEAIRRLTNSWAKESFLTWSADGNAITFYMNTGDRDLWKVDVDSMLRTKNSL